MRAALDECARASKIGFLDSTVKRPTTVIRASEGRPTIVQRPSDGRPTAVRQPSNDCPTAVRTTVRRHAHSAFWIPESPLGNLHLQFLFRPSAGGLLVDFFCNTFLRTFRPSDSLNFEEAKNGRGDSSDFNDFWTELIFMTRSIICDILRFSQFVFVSGGRRTVVGRLLDGRWTAIFARKC